MSNWWKLGIGLILLLVFSYHPQLNEKYREFERELSTTAASKITKDKHPYLHNSSNPSHNTSSDELGKESHRIGPTFVEKYALEAAKIAPLLLSTSRTLTTGRATTKKPVNTSPTVVSSRDLPKAVLTNADIPREFEKEHPVVGTDKGWLIVGFTDFNYVPVAKKWYEQMSKLGYSSHRIITMEEKAYREFQNTSYDVLEATGVIDGANGRGAQLKSIWKLRIDTVYSLLQKGYSVFITDVDSVWIRHQDLALLPNNFDAYNAVATTHPMQVYKKWGFTLCGGLGAYRPTNGTLELFRHMANSCEKSCDDQTILNSLYAGKLDMSWLEEKVSDLWQSTWIGYNRRGWKFSVMVFDQSQVLRGGSPEDCEHAWIMNPNVAKFVAAKLKMFKTFEECLIGNKL